MASFTGYEKKLSSRTAMSFSSGNTSSGWKSGRSANSLQSTVKRAKTGVLVAQSFAFHKLFGLCVDGEWLLSPSCPVDRGHHRENVK